MITEDWLARVIHKTIIKCVVVPEVQICLAPVEIALSEGHLLRDLKPIAARLQRIYDMIGVVSAPRRKSIWLRSSARFGRRSLASRFLLRLLQLSHFGADLTSFCPRLFHSYYNFKTYSIRLKG